MNYEGLVCTLFYGSTKQDVHLYFRLLANVENKNTPEVEKIRRTFRDFIKRN